MESTKVAIIGVGGIAGSALLEQINVVVAIAVGVLTFVYIATKLIFMVKDRLKSKDNGPR